MDFRPLLDTERRQLLADLRGNAEEGRVILMDHWSTSFFAQSIAKCGPRNNNEVLT